MDKKELGGFMYTNSGKKFYPLHPELLEINIEDIAHAESRNNRYGGHLEVEHYSVAQHSWLVESIASSILLKTVPTISEHSLYLFRLQALLHDASEALLQDMPKPIKETLPDFVSLEKKLETHIFTAFGLPLFIHGTIKEVDKMIRVAEVINFNRKWNYTEFFIPGKTTEDYKMYLDMVLFPWSPSEAKNMFLRRYYEIQDKSTKQLEVG